MNETGWKKGLSSTSMGRFGGLREDLTPYNSGYLAANATDTRVYLHNGDDTIDLGWFQLPGDVCRKTETDWAGNRYAYTLPDGTPHSTLTRSLLFPGFHHRIFTGRFDYYFRVRGFGPSVMVLPTGGGIKQIKATNGYDRKRDGELDKSWFMLYWCDSAMPFDVPMLFCLNRRPEKIEFWSHEYLKIYFSAETADVVQAFPFGAERLSKETTRGWKENFPEELEKTCNLLARTALAYPDKCKESFRIDGDAGKIHVRNEYEYVETDGNDWGLEPLVLAPIPLVTANLRHVKYSVEINGEVIEKICPTFGGWYEAVAGCVLEYSLPLSRFRDFVPAPVRIVNNPAAEHIREKLSDYLLSGDYLTFGGDDDYDPETTLDTLHDLRIMAWALHSIPEDKRSAAAKNLTRGLKTFSRKSYLFYKTMRTGVEWARDKTIFANRAVVDYDFEWYNGMNLAGLWAYFYFVGGESARKLIESNWELIKKIFAYVKGHSDWAYLLSWTCARGESTWLDGINYVYEGTLGYAALARAVGDAEESAWADYCAARFEAYIANCWLCADYYAEHFPQKSGRQLVPSETDLAEHLETAVVASGYWEGRPVSCTDNSSWSCGNYGYCVRELLTLYCEFGLAEKLRAAFKRFEKKFPDWKTDPYSYGKNEGYPGFDQRRTVHHYFLDPRLMVKAFVLGEDVAGMLDTCKAPLTGPVLETFLVSLAPKLLAPRDAEFLGAVWDAEKRELRVRLKGAETLKLALESPAKSAEGAVLMPDQTVENRSVYAVEANGEAEAVFRF